MQQLLLWLLSLICSDSICGTSVSVSPINCLGDDADVFSQMFLQQRRKQAVLRAPAVREGDGGEPQAACVRVFTQQTLQLAGGDGG